MKHAITRVFLANKPEGLFFRGSGVGVERGVGEGSGGGLFTHVLMTLSTEASTVK